ncbi:MAG: signal peptide peptidase SppA, partial [Nitrospirota bacterium]|nr:signal peptide peptidase SppA [Nitrospirota bacterium]
MKKVLIFFAIVIVIISALSLMMTFTHKMPIGEKIAVVRVTGMILDSTEVIDELKEYGSDSSVKAIILRVDSPGGGVAPSQEIYD